MNAQQIETAFTRLQAQRPEPQTELNYTTPFELLIAVILSAQATDVSVNLATSRLFAIARSPEAILELGLDGLKEYIKTIGLYNTKANNVIRSCSMLVDRHGGQVPDTRETLEALPGVGRKTANVVLNTAFNQPTIAVDTHIFRVSNRTAMAPGRDVVEVEQRLLEVVPERFVQHAHHWLILLGRYTCLARKPLCERCLLNDICPSAFQPPAVKVPGQKSARTKAAGKKAGKTAAHRHSGSKL